ncbi:hypothetical protein OQA88_9535 [Cercophora sp. LCS_1]
MAGPKKTIAVIGATGNQGGSVARRFLAAGYHVRALTRNPASQAAQELASLGVELVQTEIDDPASITAALAGANLIFSVTQYWEPFFRPDCRAAAAAAGISCRRYAYDVELKQGKNIADAAAATISSLDENGFIVSTLSHAGKCSGGKFTELYHFDSKAEVFPTYVEEQYPELAKKMSCVHTGYFMTSWRILPGSYFKKLDDGSFQMRFPTREDKPIPHLDVNGDTGNFVYAVSQMPPGGAYMAEGSTVGFGEYIRIFGEVTGARVTYKQVSFDEMVADTEDTDTGIEVAWMYQYADEPGYDGGMELLTAKDLRAKGIECPMTSLEEWIRKQDWSPVLGK